jgi:hypothetical protein
MKGNRGFTNKTKSGVKALPAAWRRAAEKAGGEKGRRGVAKRQEAARAVRRGRGR